MDRRVFGLLIGLGMAAGIAPPAHAQGRDCITIDEEARAAQAVGELERLIELYDEAAQPEAGCEEPYVAGFGNDIALAHVDRFFALYEQDKANAAEYKQILHDGRKYGEPWQLLRTLGEIEYELGNYDIATPYYEEALAKIGTSSRAAESGSAAAENLPTEEEFQTYHRQLAESALLSQSYARPVERRGGAEGLFAESYRAPGSTSRGFTVKSVPLAVEFVFNQTSFTDKGEKFAAHLLTYLLNEKPPSIKLVGHTDPKGSDAFNQALSEKRAEAVRDYLRGNGYEGEIKTEGRGETDPFPISKEKQATLTPDQIAQILRRVEMVRE